MSAPTPEPGSVEALRSAVLRAWRESPTRFTEDANAEEDLRRGGYRDRLFVELAQNAADAAAQAGTTGVLRVSVVDGELRVANTGVPLDVSGVASLASLRASGKRAGATTVGRFGVGFAAVLAVTDAPRIVSSGAGVAFSATRTREACAGLPELSEQLSARDGDVPVLRLPWQLGANECPVPPGFDTEVRLPLKSGVDGDVLLAGVRSSVEDVLLALPSLAMIELDGAVWTRAGSGDIVELTRPDATVTRWLTHAVSGGFSPAVAGTLGVEASVRPRWNCLWAVPLGTGGAPLPLESEVLHAPTPTDERLSLPARLIATVPVDPSRRRVAAGEAVTEVLESAARGYPGLAAKLPAAHRDALVPGGGFPLSDVDAVLSERVVEALEGRPWLPAARGTEDLTGAASRVLAVDSPALVALLADVLPGLVAAPLCGPGAVRTLGRVGASAAGAAEIVEAVTGVDRPTAWWRDVYSALGILVDSRAISADELAALPVPLRDGRTVPGPRGVLLADGLGDLADELAAADVVGLRLVHPDVAHPLLERLGAGRADAGELLDAPALAEAVARSVADAQSGVDTRPLANAVLRLVSEVGGRDRLGSLALPAEGGGWRPARELVRPGAELLAVLDPDALGEDAPLDVLDDVVAARWPAHVLAAVGVLDGFAVVSDEDPAGPDHDLPDERDWWAATASPPARVLAVRDLDLVEDGQWPAALRLLAGQPATWRALAEPRGHAGWWISRFAVLAGEAPRDLRLPTASGLRGLYDAPPDLGLREEVLRAAGLRAGLAVDDADDAVDLLDRLGDPERAVPPGLAVRVHTALAESGVDTAAVDPPARVRVSDGSVADSDGAAVLDAPWWAPVWPAHRLVFSTAPASRLAELLELPLAGERTVSTVDGDGDFVPWSDLSAVVVVADLLGFDVPPGGLIVHDELTVRVDGAAHAVAWWSARELHADDSSAGLGRALAWTAGRWDERHLIVALLEDPEPVTLLR